MVPTSFPGKTGAKAPPAIIARDILPELTRWAAQGDAPETARALPRKDRVRLYFGTEGAHWDEERVLDRYELLYEAGLVEEARRDGRPAALQRKSLPRSASPCASTIAGSSPLRLRGFAQN